MSDDFKQRFKKTYIENKHWFLILKILDRAFIDFVIEAQALSNNIISKVTSTIVNVILNISNIVEAKSELIRDL